MTMYVSVVGIFIVSARTKTPLGTLPARLGQDLSALGRSTTAVALTIAWLAASVGLILWFPRDQVVVAAETQAGEAPPPLEELSPEVIAELEAWYDTQPRVPDVAPSGSTKVLMVKFNDYQCPSCRQTWALYRDIIAKYEASHPGEFVFENRDYPLELECGAGNAGHAAACEAAAAVRMAREKGRHKETEQAIFSRQSFDMTRDDVKEALQEAAQISGEEFDRRYPSMLDAIRADVQLGQKLEVSGTPTFFLNGVRVPSLRPASIDALIAHALRKAGAAS
jgi:protein-disulfide isomerase